MSTEVVPNGTPYNCIVSNEAVSNKTENDLWTYWMVYWTALWETVGTTIERWWLSIPTKIMAECLNIGIGCEDYREPSTEGTDWNEYRTGCGTTILRAISLLGRSWRKMNITTDRHRVRATGCKGWFHIHRDWPTKLYTRARESATVPEYIYGMNDHFMRSFRDRYRVVYDPPSPTAMIPRAEATIDAGKSSPLHPWSLSANMTSKAAIMITDGLGLQSCSRGIGRAGVLAHVNIYGEYDRLLGCLQVRYTDAIGDGDGDGDGDDE